MLNEKLLSPILQVNLPPLAISDVHWKTQDSSNESLLFYRIPEGVKGERQFGDRIKSASFGWLIVNKAHPDLPANSSVISETHWPLIQKELMDILYPLPDIKLIGITGTNGKTTTTDLILQIGHQVGKRGLSVGTLGLREYGKTLLDFGLTSPPYLDLRKYLHQYGVDKEFCVMEVSSHALVQSRFFGLAFDGAGWLSFSQDHMDYHGTMENYFAAKLLLLKQLKDGARLVVPEGQQELFREISRYSSRVVTAKKVKGDLPVFFRNKFNQDNLEVALALIEDVFGLKVNIDLEKIQAPAGRFYIRPYKSSYIVVDFAHTPDALENICRGIRESFPQHRLKVLFGCGGDRDRGKRPKMGAVAETWADDIYLTSDNPRSEDPAHIIQEIKGGIQQKKWREIVDRKMAVQKALSELGEQEVLLLAGKGHEDYILLNGVKHPYSDIQEVERFLAGKDHD